MRILTAAMAGTVLAIQPVQASEDTLSEPNLDLERITQGEPEGWTKWGEGYDWEVIEREGGNALALSASTEEARFARATTRVDAAPYRGKRVAISALVKVEETGDHVGLMVSVIRPEPKSAGFRSRMDGRSIGAGDWREVTTHARIADDAEAINLGIWLEGDAAVAIDSLKIIEAPATGGAPSAEAEAYLAEAIAQIEAAHIDSPQADWDAIRRDAAIDIAGASEPADTYDAIRGVIGALGEKHSFIIIPQEDASQGANQQRGTASEPPMPRYSLRDGDTGYLMVPNFSGTPEQAARFSAVLRDGIAALSPLASCGWIVDLRQNPGGNMWPMLTGLAPLLGPEPFASFRRAAGEPITYWVREGDEVSTARADEYREPRAARRQFDLRPVAVLQGPNTSSSGEMTAVALRGRENVRFFGEDTAGFTTANSGHRMPDGLLVIITSSFVADRTGTGYRTSMSPDVETPVDEADAAARDWLRSGC